jgi:hypothetical protein
VVLQVIIVGEIVSNKYSNAPFSELDENELSDNTSIKMCLQNGKGRRAKEYKIAK